MDVIYLIEINGVSKLFGGFAAVDDVSLKIEEGEFLGLLGPNGAGKSTLIKLLTGLLKPTAGVIYIDGQVMSRNNMEIKKRIGVVPQYTNLDKELTVYENLVFAAKLFKIKNYNKKIDELLVTMELDEHRNKKSMNLSGGMQRRLMIAKALINDPDIVFLDEPTVGIDLNGRRKIWDILKSMKAMGKTILLTTHYIEEADYLCNQVCLINEGKAFEKETPEKSKKDLGIYTVEYFDSEMKTKYEYFKERKDAEKYASNVESISCTIRETTLEDVFYNFTNRKVV